MQDATLAWQIDVEEDALFDSIGAFLDTHGLSPDPAHYAFAYAVLIDPAGPLAIAVAKRTEGGVRLSSPDIEQLGWQVVSGRPVVAKRRPARAVPADENAHRLVAETQQQVDGFASMMRTMQAETRGFGKHLVESAEAMTRAPQIAELDEIAQITSAMIARIHATEVRLARATEETEGLRKKLAEARDTARRDSLTGLPNRRAFDEAILARPPEGQYCLAICDIDRFKRINDEHGHAVGDRVLTAIGQVLTAECEGHLVARHGGEEFAILLTGVALADAAAMLDEVRDKIAARRFRNRENDIPLGQITFSAGIAAIQPGEDPADAFGRADRLLYTAKAEGRDRICAG